MLLGSSDIIRTRITEKINILVKPMHPQTIIKEIGPFNVYNVITFELNEDCVAAIPIALSRLTMNEVK